MTKIAVREARLKEIRQEMLNSVKLQSHLADNPRDAQLLKHLQHIVEVIAVDEEAAELKAADIGRGRRASA